MTRLTLPHSGTGSVRPISDAFWWKHGSGRRGRALSLTRPPLTIDRRRCQLRIPGTDECRRLQVSSNCLPSPQATLLDTTQLARRWPRPGVLCCPTQGVSLCPPEAERAGWPQAIAATNRRKQDTKNFIKFLLLQTSRIAGDFLDDESMRRQCGRTIPHNHSFRDSAWTHVQRNSRTQYPRPLWSMD